MQPESVWKWLEAVDQEHLDPLDQWRVPTRQIPTQETVPKSDNVFRGRDARLLHADAASPLKAAPPSGLLLRTGNIRMIGLNSSSDEGKKQHPKPPVPNSPATVTVDVKRKPSFQPAAPSTVITPKATGQRAHPSPTRPLQPAAQEGKHIAIRRKRLPTYLERAHTEALQTIPVIQVEVTDPVAVECQGARVEGGDMSSKMSSSRRHTTATGEGSLHRSNALKRPSNVRPVSRFRRID